MGTMVVVITSVLTLLVVSRAAAERASNSLQTKELAMVYTIKTMHSLLVHAWCTCILCKVHVKGLHKFSYKYSMAGNFRGVLISFFFVVDLVVTKFSTHKNQRLW